MNNYQKGKRFEEFVHYVYSNLITLNNTNAQISKRTTLMGRSGSTSEFDIYYEFYHLNIKHKVAIECKNHKKPVSSKEVRDFIYKIKDIGNTIGVMISKNGYQTGAEQIANYDYIKLMTIDELPSFFEILSMQISDVFLPDQNVIGMPFWVIMNLTQDGDINGNYMTMPNDFNDESEFLIPLFFSKYVAEKYNEIYYNKRGSVRGVNQRQLNALYSFAELHNFEFVEILFEPDKEKQGIHFLLRKEDLKKKYILDKD